MTSDKGFLSLTASLPLIFMEYLYHSLGPFLSWSDTNT